MSTILACLQIHVTLERLEHFSKGAPCLLVVSTQFFIPPSPWLPATCLLPLKTCIFQVFQKKKKKNPYVTLQLASSPQCVLPVYPRCGVYWYVIPFVGKKYLLWGCYTLSTSRHLGCSHVFLIKTATVNALLCAQSLCRYMFTFGDIPRRP